MSAPVQAQDRISAGTVAAYLAICLIWGSTFLAIRIAVHTIPPWTMAGTRSAVAGAILTLVALARGARMPDGAGWYSAIVSGVLLFTVSQAVLCWGETRLPSGTAAVLGCTVSLFTPMVSWLTGGSGRPGIIAAVGLALGFAGVVVLVPPGAAGADLFTSTAVVLSSLAWAFGAALARRVKPAASPLLASGLQLLAGGAASLFFAGTRGEWLHLQASQVSQASLLAMLYLIVMGSLVAYACFGWLVQIWQPERLTTYAYVNPIVALLLGAAWMSEPLGIRQFAATAMILAAVALCMLPRQKTRALATARSA